MTDPVPSKDLLDKLVDQIKRSPDQEERAVALAEQMSLAYWGYRPSARVIIHLHDEIERLRTALRGIQSCSTCEACRNVATMALGGAAPEPAADAAEAMLEAGRQVYGGGWIDHGPDCTEAGCSCGLEQWIRRYHKLLKLDISHWPAKPPGDGQG